MNRDRIVPDRMAADPGEPAVCPVIDRLGGLKAARSRLHALHPARPGDEGAATGFAFASLIRLDAHPRPVLWVQHRAGLAEAGRPYGPGLAAFGIDPARIVVAAVAALADVFAAAEMGLALGGLTGVLVELPARVPASLLKLGQRLALRAEATATPCFLLHASAAPVQAPVATRWQVAARRGEDALLPAFDLELQKNRFGPTGRVSVLWVCHDRSFRSLPHADKANTGAVAAASFDRPRRTERSPPPELPGVAA